jgi:hypothetical protein
VKDTAINLVVRQPSGLSSRDPWPSARSAFEQGAYGLIH